MMFHFYLKKKFAYIVNSSSISSFNPLVAISICTYLFFLLKKAIETGNKLITKKTWLSDGLKWLVGFPRLSEVMDNNCCAFERKI